MVHPGTVALGMISCSAELKTEDCYPVTIVTSAVDLVQVSLHAPRVAGWFRIQLLLWPSACVQAQAPTASVRFSCRRPAWFVSVRFFQSISSV
jgi:hypothetical protein